MYIKTKKRMYQPEDVLIKRQAVYAGDVLHKYYKFPGKYIGAGPNEFPDVDGVKKRVDATQYIKLNNDEAILNIEDESVKVDEETLKKINDYKINIEYMAKCPVVSAITTTVPINNCLQEYSPSPTQILKPLIKSLPEYMNSERLNSIKTKIESNKALTKIEAMDVVMTPRMHTKNQDLVLEEVCPMLRDLKIEEANFKYEMLFEMQCIIHKYAKTLDDIIELEEMIQMYKTAEQSQYHANILLDQMYGDGMIEGNLKGRFEMALKIKEIYGIKQAIKLSGFSRKELETGKLNR